MALLHSCWLTACLPIQTSSSSLFPITFHKEVRSHMRKATPIDTWGPGPQEQRSCSWIFTHFFSHPRLRCLGTSCPVLTVGSRLSGTFYGSPSLCGHGRHVSLLFCCIALIFYFYFCLVMDATTSRGTSIPLHTEKEAGLRGGGSLVLCFRSLREEAKVNPPQMQTNRKQPETKCLCRRSH